MSANLMQRFLGAIGVGRLYLAEQKGIIAATTQTQAAATQLTKALNFVDTVAHTSDGVKMPACEKGLVVVVSNQGANTLTLYSKETTGVSFSSNAGATGISISAGATGMFFGRGDNWAEIS